MIFRRVAIALMFCAAACQSESQTYTPPKVGTVFSWQYLFEDSVDDAEVEVVATGPDFAVFLENDATAFVEFSGLEFAGCEDDMPTRETRSDLNKAWPLAPGTELKTDSATITIDEESVTRLGSKNEPVVWVSYAYNESDEADDAFAVSTNIGAIVHYKWGSGGEDQLVSVAENDVETVEVQPGYVMKKGLIDELVTGCMKLLSEEN